MGRQAGPAKDNDRMKYKTALRQSQVSVKFLAWVILVMLVLSVKYPGRYTLIPLVIFVLYFAMDAYNIRRIRRRAAQDPTFLEQKLK